MVTVKINTRISPLIDETFIYNIAFSTMDKLGFNDDEISIVIDTDDKLRSLNKTYRNNNEPTDVLSFPSGELNPDSGLRYLGDVIISFPRVKEQAIEHGHSNKKELTTLIVHGILHLAGYDHTTGAEEKKMFELQNEIIGECAADWTVAKSNSFFDSFLNAHSGFVSALKTERNLWIHLSLALLSIGMGFALQIALLEWTILVLVISAVITTELFNTALEYLVNFASPEKNELARIAKDIGAASVLVVAIASVVIGAMIFIPRLLPLFISFY